MRVPEMEYCLSARWHSEGSGSADSCSMMTNGLLLLWKDPMRQFGNAGKQAECSRAGTGASDAAGENEDGTPSVQPGQRDPQDQQRFEIKQLKRKRASEGKSAQRIFGGFFRLPV